MATKRPKCHTVGREKGDGDSGTFPAHKPKVGTAFAASASASEAPRRTKTTFISAAAERKKKVNFPLKTELMVSRGIPVLLNF